SWKTDRGEFYHGIVRDITERKLAERAIRDSEAQLASIIGSAMDSIITIDGDQRVFLFNAAAEKMFHCSADEVIGHTVDRFIPERFRSAHREHVRAFGESGATNRSMGLLGTLFGVRSDGQEFPIEASISQVEVGGKKLYTVILRDIAERKKMEQELEVRERNLNSFFTTAPAGLAMLDSDLRFLRINDLLANIHGLPVEEHLGKTVREVLPELAGLIEPKLRRVLDTGEAAERFETSGETPAEPGVLRHWVASYFPIMSEGGKTHRIGVIVVELTERKRAEDQLRMSQKQLRALAARLQSVREEERTRIAREIHDELGQALTGLMMDVSWLSSRLAQDQTPLLEKTKSMSQLIDATIQSVRKICTELRPGVLDAFGLTAGIEWQAQEFEARTGIESKIATLPEGRSLDTGRSTAVFRIFQEILTNVARHANATEVYISLEEQAGSLILEVRDNGRGIAGSEIDDPKSLGLLGMRERARPFGGEVRFSGSPGEGTRVTVRVPLD
ncbi:MAG: PAS domain S-box protein, partial [Blastocatellia bacterium]|nr:PAS domain S-box protein [Blastocatellia bacterium]